MRDKFQDKPRVIRVSCQCGYEWTAEMDDKTDIAAFCEVCEKYRVTTQEQGVAVIANER